MEQKNVTSILVVIVLGICVSIVNINVVYLTIIIPITVYFIPCCPISIYCTFCSKRFLQSSL